MILNPFSILDGFAALLRLVLSVLIIGFALHAWQRWRSTGKDPDHSGTEDRYYLLVILSGVLLALNLAGWPLFYLMLQSYVPQWPGVMCVYGVTQIGSHSVGVSRFLPGLVNLLETTKPLLVFVGGTWLVLHLANRRTATGPLMGRILLVLLVLGLIGIGDGAAETAYLAIPKTEEGLEAGCCTIALDDPDSVVALSPGHATAASRLWQGLRTVPHLGTLLRDELGERGIAKMYYGINISLILAVAGALWVPSCRPGPAGLLSLVIAAVVSFPISLLFLIEVAAPAILNLPYHHCPYDLIPKAPESLVGVCLYMLGLFAVGWACTLAWLADCLETRSFLPRAIGRLLGLALFGYLGSLIMIYLEMALA
jgi:hypothetical protein